MEKETKTTMEMFTSPAKRLSYPLNDDVLQLKVQGKPNNGKQTVLVYKDARADINRLNEIMGPENWRRGHRVINGVQMCSVGVKGKDGEWADKEDAGTVGGSGVEDEKTAASDSFKRACFNLGIGIQLYSLPRMQLECADSKKLWLSNYSVVVGYAVDYPHHPVLVKVILKKDKTATPCFYDGAFKTTKVWQKDGYDLAGRGYISNGEVKQVKKK